MRCLSDIITVGSIKKERVFTNTSEGNNVGEKADTHCRRTQQAREGLSLEGMEKYQ